MTARMAFVSTAAGMIALAATGAQAALAAAPAPHPRAKADEVRSPSRAPDAAYWVDGKLLRGEDARTTFTIEDDRWIITWRKDGEGTQVEQGTAKGVECWAGRKSWT